MTIKIKVSALVLTETRNESLPQEFTARHQTVRISPGTYDVFAYLDADRTVHQLSAECGGITRRFHVDNSKMTSDELRGLDVSLSGSLHSIDQLTIDATRPGWSWNLKRSCNVTRPA
jgi:hypothetical protein